MDGFHLSDDIPVDLNNSAKLRSLAKGLTLSDLPQNPHQVFEGLPKICQDKW